MQGFAYFPAIIYRDEQPNFAEELRNICYNKLKASNTDQICSIIQSDDVTNASEFHSLKKYLLKSSIDILQNQGYDVDLYNFYVSDLWIQQLNHGASTDIHVHKNSQISGWLFIDTPKKGSFPLYYDPRILKEMVELQIREPDTISNSTSIINFQNVYPGTVLFNNSWLKHQLSFNESDQATVAIHFIISYDERKDRVCNM